MNTAVPVSPSPVKTCCASQNARDLSHLLCLILQNWDANLNMKSWTKFQDQVSYFKGNRKGIWRCHGEFSIFSPELCFLGYREMKTGCPGKWWIHGFTIPGRVPKMSGGGTWGHYLVVNVGWSCLFQPLWFHEILALVSLPSLGILLCLPALLGPILMFLFLAAKYFLGFLPKSF